MFFTVFFMVLMSYSTLHLCASSYGNTIEKGKHIVPCMCMFVRCTSGNPKFINFVVLFTGCLANKSIFFKLNDVQNLYPETNPELEISIKI